MNKVGTVGAKFGPKFNTVGIIGAQIGPSGHYRGWIWSKGGFGLKSGHIVWDGYTFSKKIAILCWSGDSRCHHSHTIWLLFSKISTLPTPYDHFGENEHIIVQKNWTKLSNDPQNQRVKWAIGGLKPKALISPNDPGHPVDTFTFTFTFLTGG